MPRGSTGKPGSFSPSSNARRVRLDRLLVQKGLVPGRDKARALIMAGAVQVEGVRVDKAGRLVSPTAAVTVSADPNPYASRGGLKLEAALRQFGITLEGLTVMDVGASTGGFTDCLLRHGAERVISVDVGYGQLAWPLRNDPRVVVMERTNIRHLKPEELRFPVQGATVDVSFISLKLVVPVLSRLLTPHAFLVLLIKPQFEVGKGLVGKGGVVRDPDLQQRVVEEIAAHCQGEGWSLQGVIPSPLLGPKGNREFLMHLTR